MHLIDVQLSDDTTAAVHQYIVSLHVVTFDIEHGATVEYTWPHNAHTAAEYINISGCSLPDSNTNSTVESVNSTHIFRFRCTAGSAHQHLYGYVCYCQKYDDTQQRQYKQKSVVLISHLPYINFFTQCVTAVGEQYFASSTSQCTSVLHNALIDISAWTTASTDGVSVQLLGVTLTLPTISASSHHRIHAPSSQLFADRTTLHHSESAPTDVANLERSTSDGARNGSHPTSPAKPIMAPPRPSSIKSSRYYTFTGHEPDSAPVYTNSRHTYNSALSPTPLRTSYSNTTSLHNAMSAPTSPANDTAQQSQSTPITPRNPELHNYYATMSTGKQLQFNADTQASATANNTDIGTASAQQYTIQSSVNIYKTFKPILANLWLLYELVLCNESLIILGSNPQICSNAVLAAIGLISPIQYTGDFKPYFTLYDTDFAVLTSTLSNAAQAASANVILGVTNAQLLRTFYKVPHVLIINDTQFVDESAVIKTYTTTKPYDSVFDTTTCSTCTLVTSHTPTFQPSASILRRLLSNKPATPRHTKVRSNSFKPSTSQHHVLTPRASYNDVQLVRGSSDFTPHSVGSTPRNKPTTHHDQHVIDSINDAVIRNHFKHMTQYILEPLTPYVNLTPAQLTTIHSTTFNPYLHNVKLPQFDASLFLNTIQIMPIEQIDRLPLQPSTLKSVRRTALQTLYSKLIKSSNFANWYNTERRHGQQQLNTLIESAILKLYNQPRESAFTKLLDGQKVEHTFAMYSNACKLYHKAVADSNTALAEAVDKHRQLIRQCTP